MAITEGTQPVAKTWTGNWNTAQTTASFIPESGALLVALLSADGDASNPTTGAITDSLGGTWTLLKRQNTQVVGVVGGTCEVWCRDSPAAALTVSATGTSGLFPGGQLVVRTLIGALATAQQNGATAGATLQATAVQVSVTAGTGGKVYGAAFNFDNSTVMTALGNTTVANAFSDGTNGDTWEAFKSTGDTAGTATYGYSTSHNGMIAAVEIKAAAATGEAFIPQRQIRKFGPRTRFRQYHPIHRGLFEIEDAGVAATSASAESAGFTVLAQDAAIALGVNADPVALTIAGQDAVAALGAQAENVPITLATQDATAAVAVNAGVAAISFTSNDAVAAITVNADFAPVNLVANDATVSTASATNAPAELASFTLTGNDASVAVAVNAEAVPITLTANDAVAGIVVNAGVATWTLTGQDATITTGVQADAGLAFWTMSGLDASTALRANADNAVISLAGLDAAIPLQISRGSVNPRTRTGSDVIGRARTGSDVNARDRTGSDVKTRNRTGSDVTGRQRQGPTITGR